METNKDQPANWSVLTGETPPTLQAKWRQQRERADIIAFYHDWKGVPWREFSNWYEHKGHGFEFVLPQQLLELAGVPPEDRDFNFAPVVYCENSEKALMLCKAAVMGDAASYAGIALAPTAKECKQRGRHIANWNEKRWEQVVCGVAVCTLRQKFAVPALREVLMSTGDKVLCEATAHDKRWAIGISIKMPKVYEVPARWKGSNILGWALMQVRALIRQEAEQETEAEEAEYGVPL